MRLTFLHTSDIHSRLVPYTFEPSATDESLGLLAENAPYGGAARLAYLVKRERERSQRVMHLDSGDCYQGAPIGNFKQGEAEIRFMSMLKTDAVVIGNHEFDSGVNTYVNQLSQWMKYTNLAANYVFPDWKNPNNNQLGKYAQPFAIYDLEGVKIGVIGMANLSSLNSIGEGGNSLGITPMEQNSVVRHYVDFLHPIVDLVAIVSHLGMHEDEEVIRGYEHIVNVECNENVKDRRYCLQPDWEVIEYLPENRARVWIPGVSDVDIIFGGHLHIALNPPKVVEAPNGRHTLIVHSGAFAKYLGRLDVMVEPDKVVIDGEERTLGKKIATHKFQLFPVDNRLAAFEDAEVARMMEPYLLGLNRDLDLSRVIAYAPRLIPRRGNSNSGDSPLANLLTEAMRARRRVEAEFSITNTLGIRDNIYPGPITLETMFNIMPFENTVTVMYLSGRDVQDLFDFVTFRSASRGCQPQAQIAGVRFTQNCARVLENERTGETIHAAEDILINGAPIDPNGTYKMATNNYVAAGGSGFQVLKRNTQKFDTGVSLRDSFIDYVTTHFPSCSVYAVETGVCDLDDPESQRVCEELRKYPDVPCIEGAQDGRIQQKFVLSEDAGKVKDKEEDKTAGDIVGGTQ